MARKAIRLLLVTGNPGAGKTELVTELGARLPGTWSVVHADEYIPEVFRRHPGRKWPQIRPQWPGIAGEAVAKEMAQGHSVVYDGVLLSTDEAKTVARACGLDYPDPEVALLDLRCAEDTVVRRRMMIPWDRFGIPKTLEERRDKEAVIRSHHREHPMPNLAGARLLENDGLSRRETFRAVLKWLAERSTASA